MTNALPRTALRQNYWPVAAHTTSVWSPLGGDVECDVVVIGAGIMGLSAALELAERGASVVIVEAAQPAEAASGRNGGLVVPSLPRLGPADVYRLLGELHGKRLVEMVAQGAQTVFDTVARYQLDCDAVQGGWLNPAHAQELTAGLRGRVDAWRRAGSRARWLDGPETRRRIGSDSFHGALFDPSGGHLNPYAYTNELARVAVGAGARLYGDSPVLRAEVRDGRHRLYTAKGCVTGAAVLQCTNAMSFGSAIAPEIGRSFVPLTVFQLATRVLEPEVRRSLLTGNEALSDTRNNLFAVRLTADGRLVTGGMAPVTQWLAEPRLLRGLARRMTRIFPQLGEVSFDYIWRGGAALTPDLLPRIFELGPNWLAPLGCNGRGIAMTTSLGRRLADFMLTRNPDVLPLPLSRAAPIKGYTVARYAPQWLLPVGMMQDAMRR